MELFEKQLDENLEYKGRLLTIVMSHVELPDGTTARREVVRHPGGVCIVAIDREGKVIVVNQYRFAVSRKLTEIPAGKLEPGEDPLDSAIRELSEETGCTAEKVVSLGKLFATPGYCGEQMYLYLAIGLTDGEQHLDKGEFLTMDRIDFNEMVAMCGDGRINDAKTVAGIFRAKCWLDSHPEHKI